MQQELNPEPILQLATAFGGSKTLLSAVELGVFTALADGPKNSATLAKELGLHPRSKRDFLDALVALGMLDREQDVYCNTPPMDAFLDRRKPSYIGGRWKCSAPACIHSGARLPRHCGPDNHKMKAKAVKTRSRPSTPTLLRSNSSWAR